MADVELLPCPFCGAGKTEIRENGRPWLGMRYGDPSSVSVRHWCEPIEGQPSRMIERVGRDRAAAIAAWNTRATDANLAALQAENERLRAEVERLNAELVRLEKIAGYGGLASDAPERMILASEVYDGMQSCDKWCEVRRVIDDGQPMPESATPYVRADRAERLAEALRELVEVFSESGMYDEEVFDKARAELDQENKQ